MDIELPAGCAAKYRGERVLGAGGFGIVVLATHRELERHAAVKLIHPQAAADPTVAGRFRLEARLTAQLDHPHVVRVLDHDVDAAQPWIAYEYLPGETLREAMPIDGMPWRQALAIAIQIAAGLEAAHAAGVLHRDLKPANVLRAADGTWKLADFGMARGQGESDFTGSGFVVGTPGFMAPEMLDGVAASPASDLYALGAMLHEMLTGDLPYGRAPVLELLERAREGVRPRLTSVRRDVPAALDVVFDQILAPQPAQRTPSAACFAVQLKAVLDGRFAPPLPVGPVRTAKLAKDTTVVTRHSAPRRTVPMPIARRPAPWPRAAALLCVMAGSLAGLALAAPVARALKPEQVLAAGALAAPDLAVRLGERLGRVVARSAERASLPQMLVESYGAGFDATACGARARRLAAQEEHDREELAAIAAAAARADSPDAAVVSAVAQLSRFASGCRLRFLRHFNGGADRSSLADLPEVLVEMDRPAAAGDPSRELADAAARLVHAAVLLSRQPAVAPETLARLARARTEAMDWHRAFTWSPEAEARLEHVHASVARSLRELSGPSANAVRAALVRTLRDSAKRR